jgi:hypothetical protein
MVLTISEIRAVRSCIIHSSILHKTIIIWFIVDIYMERKLKVVRLCNDDVDTQIPFNVLRTEID